MNGLREYRNKVAQEESESRFKQIEEKLDAILAALSLPATKQKAEKAKPVASE